MIAYQYNAMDQSGKKVSGQISAEGRAAALAQLKAWRLIPSSLRESNGDDVSDRDIDQKDFSRPGRGKRVSRADIDFFTRELANLLTAGVPLSRALYLLSRQTSRPGARQQWGALRDDVVGGMSLAGAMGRWPRSFPPVYIAMVRAGETGGFLDIVLAQIADFRVREDELKGRVKAALVYPAVLASLAALVMVFLLIYFIPRFTAIFADFDEALPWLTRAVVGFSQFLLQYNILIVTLIFLAVLGIRRLLDSAAGSRRVEALILSLPGVGTVAARFALVRFCRMLGTLFEAGVPLLAALRVAREAIGNSTLADTVGMAMDEVRRGAALSASLAMSQRLFPESVVEMMAVAEESGRLSKELLRIAAVYESELDRRMRMLVALAEPALLFVMAAVIGTVVIGMLLPIFTLQELIQ